MQKSLSEYSLSDISYVDLGAVVPKLLKRHLATHLKGMPAIEKTRTLLDPASIKPWMEEFISNTFKDDSVSHWVIAGTPTVYKTPTNTKTDTVRLQRVWVCTDTNGDILVCISILQPDFTKITQIYRLTPVPLV